MIFSDSYIVIQSHSHGIKNISIEHTILFIHISIILIYHIVLDLLAHISTVNVQATEPISPAMIATIIRPYKLEDIGNKRYNMSPITKPISKTNIRASLLDD